MSAHYWLERSFIDILANESKNIKTLSYLIILFVLTHLVAFTIIVIQTLRYKWLSFRQKVSVDLLILFEILRDSPLDKKLFGSYARNEPLLISLSNRKVYVGIVTWLGEPNEFEGMDQEISILPVLSGYRDKKDQTVVFTTNYSKVANLDNPQIIIKQDLIETLSDFDIDIYANFAKQNKQKQQNNYTVNIDNPTVRITQYPSS